MNRSLRTARRTARRASRLESIAVGSLVLFVIAMTSYAGSSLIGHALLEQARREGIRAEQRTRFVRAEIVELRGEVDRLRHPAAIRRWAALRGFALPSGSWPEGGDPERPIVVAFVRPPRAWNGATP